MSNLGGLLNVYFSVNLHKTTKIILKFVEKESQLFKIDFKSYTGSISPGKFL